MFPPVWAGYALYFDLFITYSVAINSKQLTEQIFLCATVVDQEIF